MAAPVLNRKIEMALRIAISKGGRLGYNPDMYRLGFADNIPPSESFNAELKKYGSIAYDCYDDIYGWPTPMDGAWHSFTINAHGREVIKEIDRERNGAFGYKKLIRFTCSAFGILFSYVLGLAIFCTAAYFLAKIDYSQEYSWYMGIWHALFATPNFILHHCYDSDILYFANQHTTAYSIFFWLIFVVSVIPSLLRLLKTLIVDLLRKWFNPFE